MIHIMLCGFQSSSSILNPINLSTCHVMNGRTTVPKVLGHTHAYAAYIFFQLYAYYVLLQ